MYLCFGISGVCTVLWVFWSLLRGFSHVNYWCWFILLFSTAYWFCLDWLIAFRVFPYCSNKSESYCFRCLTPINWYPSVSLSPTLSMNEKVEQHKKEDSQTQCLKVLGWRWCHSLMWVDSVLILMKYPRFSPSNYPTSGIRFDGLWLGQVQFDYVSKVFLTEVSSERSPRFSPSNYPTSGIKADGLRLGRVQFDFVSKVFLTEVSSESPVFPLKLPNKWYQSRWFAAWASIVWLYIESLPDRGFKWGSFMIKVRYLSVSLSPTLSRNEKVEQHIRKKTHKPNALSFFVEGGVIPLYVGSVLILVRSPPFCPLD